MTDWAIKEAREIADFLHRLGRDDETLELLACRLRILKCAGVAEGIANVKKALAETHAEEERREREFFDTRRVGVTV